MSRAPTTRFTHSSQQTCRSRCRPCSKFYLSSCCLCLQPASHSTCHPCSNLRCPPDAHACSQPCTLYGCHPCSNLCPPAAHACSQPCNVDAFLAQIYVLLLLLMLAASLNHAGYTHSLHPSLFFFFSFLQPALRSIRHVVKGDEPSIYLNYRVFSRTEVGEGKQLVQRCAMEYSLVQELGF